MTARVVARGDGAHRKASLQAHEAAYPQRGRTVVRRLSEAGVTMDVPADLPDDLPDEA